jgi:hypothetical protein
MLTRGWCVMAILSTLLAAPAGAAPTGLPPVLEDTLGRVGSYEQLARLAVGDDEAAARAARASLHAAGPAGLRAFETVHAQALDAAAEAIAAAADARFDRSDPAGLHDPARARLLSALDTICAQKDCVLSRLYWHTDLAEATRRATAENKPILSLRLLGDLGDELSCANSRFFRALLYPDPQVRALLRERFVLHWASERPAAKLTIDLGDGRTIVTTITGNSAHFVLDPSGRPVDVVPGLLDPQAFVAALAPAEALARATARQDHAARRKALAEHHAARLETLDRDWQAALVAAGERSLPTPQARTRTRPAPRAGEAAEIAITKSRVEIPTLEAQGEPIAPDPAAARFERLAARNSPAIVLSRASLGLVRTQQWRSGDPAADAGEFTAALAGLRRALALDTLRNQHELHRAVHGWFVNGAADLGLDALARRVYGELFLTPRSDPWLGLADPSTYAGLTGGGRRAQAHL